MGRNWKQAIVLFIQVHSLQNPIPEKNPHRNVTVYKYIQQSVQLPTEETLSSITCSRAMKHQFLEQKNLHITDYLGTTFPVLVTATDRQVHGSLNSSSQT